MQDLVRCLVLSRTLQMPGLTQSFCRGLILSRTFSDAWFYAGLLQMPGFMQGFCRCLILHRAFCRCLICTGLTRSFFETLLLSKRLLNWLFFRICIFTFSIFSSFYARESFPFNLAYYENCYNFFSFWIAKEKITSHQVIAKPKKMRYEKIIAQRL